jgi:hypothetical protein
LEKNLILLKGFLHDNPDAHYGIAILAAFYEPWVAGGIYVFVALMWLIPDRRIERMLDENKT